MLPLDFGITADVVLITGRHSKRRQISRRQPTRKLEVVVSGFSDALFMVAEFHHAFNLPSTNAPTTSIPADLRQLRIDLIVEEVKEFVEASAQKDIIGIADALADILYVVYGAAVTYGIDLDAVVREVHRSNMSKLGESGLPILREDGKVLKSHLYRPPDVAAVLDRQLPLPL